MEGGKLGLLILLLVFTSSFASVTDEMNDSDVSDLSINDQKSEEGSRFTVRSHGGTKKVCLLCETYAAQAQDFIRQRKMQTEIIHTLQQYCPRLPISEQHKQCFYSLGKFGHVFLSEMSGVKPGNFCRRAEHCRKVVSYAQKVSSNSCNDCKTFLVNVAAALKNTATQTEVLQILTMVCSLIGPFAEQCKTFLTSFGPMFMSLIVSFLEGGQLCDMIGCESPPDVA